MKTSTKEKKTGTASKVLSIVGIVLCVVFGFMLVCNLTIIIKGTIDPDTPPSVLGITPMVVQSGSMSGTAEDHIEVGDMIFVGKAVPEELKVGDVISFKQGKIIVTHRIIEIQRDGVGALQFMTKGDANPSADTKPVHQDDLVGIYRSRIPKVGDFAMFLQTPLGMAVFIGLPMLAFIIYDIIRRQRDVGKESKRNAELEAELARLRALAGEDAPAQDGEPVK